MGTIADGVRQALENCLRVKSGEHVVIISDRQTLSIGEALKAGAEAVAEDVRLFVMEDFGSRPVAFPDRIGEAIATADVSIYAAQGAQGELQTFRIPMLKVVEANQKLRHGHMIGITPEIMADGMCSDYAEIQRVSKRVFEVVRGAKEIRVTTERGCDFTGQFSPDLKWIVCDGDIQPGTWMNLPEGEVFTAPVRVDGKIVIDGCLGDFFTERYASLEETPVTVEVQDGRAIKESLQCANEQLKAEFAKYIFETDENSDRIGEFAIGTNMGLTKLIYNLLQDEKFPGIHVAFGSPYPTKTGATWNSKGHVDGVLIAPTIIVDGQTLMETGQFCFD